MLDMFGRPHRGVPGDIFHIGFIHTREYFVGDFGAWKLCETKGTPSGSHQSGFLTTATTNRGRIPAAGYPHTFLYGFLGLFAFTSVCFLEFTVKVFLMCHKCSFLCNHFYTIILWFIFII